MALYYYLNINIEDTTPEIFLNWLISNQNLALPDIIKLGDNLIILEMEPCLGSDIHDNLSIYEADISIRALVKNPRQFLDDKNNFNQQIIKAGISQEIIDKLFSDPKDPVLLGSIEIISLGSSNYIQVVGALQYDSSGIMERIGKYILEIYGTRAHKNLDGQQLNIDDYKKLKDLYKDLISQHIETLENQNEDRDTVRKVINLRDERIASLQEKIN